METNKIMKKQYLITREQLDRVVDTYLTDKMRGGRVVTNNHKYSKPLLTLRVKFCLFFLNGVRVGTMMKVRETY